MLTSIGKKNDTAETVKKRGGNDMTEVSLLFFSYYEKNKTLTL